ncbi:DapH/DapD/GlmU-related protein [Cellulophaga lytica]|nr:DapH/DapD/GlmU-related protein [Cellulophaga lytica]
MKIVKKVIVFFVRIIGPVFFKKKYLTGKHFNKNGVGWTWVAKAIWRQKILGFNRFVPWPISHTTTVSNWKNITFHTDDLNNFQSPGCYFQNFSAKITFRKGVYIAPNVGLITANHDLKNLEEHTKGQDIVLGENCWIGMNSVILPGVTLNSNIIVGAGSVVTKSFNESNIIIAGSPAKKIKNI